LRFVNQSILDFLGEYDSYKSGMSRAREYDNHCSRFLEAVSYLEKTIARFTEMKQGTK